jgi:transcriptional regulatory protein GAL4
VEELLRIATEIINKRLPDIDLYVELERSRNGESEYESNAQRDNVWEDHPRDGSSKRPRSMSEHCPPEQTASEAQHSADVEYDLYATHIESLISPPESKDTFGSTDLPPAVSLDNPSLNGMDYDWDERHSEAALGLDGMASLSFQDEKPGYLGLASGAALLHLIQCYTSDPFASMPSLHHATAVPNNQLVRNQAAVDFNREISSHKVARYISDYFNTYHISYPLVHQGLFMAQYNEIVPRPKNGWMVLMYVVAAIGAFMAATTPNDDDLVLFHRARSYLSVEMLEIGNLTLVQSLTLISNYLQKRDRPNSGYNYLGLALRMAFGLGLHKEFPNWKSSLLHMEMRRRTWWCLYIFDTGTTITYSRPLSIPSTGIDAKLPLNTFDSDLNAATATCPENVSTPTIYTNVRVQSQFHLLTNNLYNRIISKPFPSAKEVLAWDDLYIGKWLSLVPEYYKEDATVPKQHALAHGIMIWRYKHFRMIIYRPFLIQKVLMSSRSNFQTGQSPGLSENSGSSGNREARSLSSLNTELACERCRKESHETIRHIDQHWKNHSHTRMASWYALYFLFPAVLVPLISLRNEPQSPLANSWRDDINIATQIVKSMVELIPSAARCLELLEKLSAGFFIGDTDQPQGSTSEEGLMQHPINESPITQILSMRSMMFPDPPAFGIEEQLL